jgi:hypothetical protein
MEIFYGSGLRLARAREHLADLKARINVFRQEYKDGFAFDFDPDTQRLTLGAQNETGKPWPMFSVLVGEVTYNLRAALDYFIYELAAIDSGMIQDGTQFPIEDTPEGFKRRRATFLKGVSDEHVALIDRLQPHAGCHWTKRLASLSNPDKHRQLAVLDNLSEASAVIRKGTPGSFSSVKGGRVFQARTGPNPVDVHVDFDISIRVAFRDETGVVETLDELQNEVAAVLQQFKAVLGT